MVQNNTTLIGNTQSKEVSQPPVVAQTQQENQVNYLVPQKIHQNYLQLPLTTPVLSIKIIVCQN